MRFRPCIDIHNGRVKQIVGGSLSDEGDQARENFVSDRDGAYYSSLYYDRGLSGGHVILLNARGSASYEATKAQAFTALSAHPGFLQAGGGIDAENAETFLEAGASHVIVTSYVFHDGEIAMDRLEKMKRAVGKEHLVLDLSCRRVEDGYVIVTDRWQRLTKSRLDLRLLEELSAYADEFLIHAVDVEGKQSGIEEEVVRLLGSYQGIPVTYAGGIASFSDIAKVRTLGGGKVDITIGSALDLFGGTLPLQEVLDVIGQTK